MSVIIVALFDYVLINNKHYKRFGHAFPPVWGGWGWIISSNVIKIRLKIPTHMKNRQAAGVLLWLIGGE